MDLQHDRIRDACSALKLESLIDAYPQLSAKAVANGLTFPDFLEGLLKAELAARQARSRTTLTKLAGLLTALPSVCLENSFTAPFLTMSETTAGSLVSRSIHGSQKSGSRTTGVRAWISATLGGDGIVTMLHVGRPGESGLA